MTKYQQILKRYGLERMTVPAHTADIVDKRIAGLWEANYCGCAIGDLPRAIKKYGFDCYTQGLLDATGPIMRARIEKLALEGVIPPMDASQFTSGSQHE